MNNYLDKKNQIMALEGRSVGDIIGEGLRILGNPIAMFDTSYNLLWHNEGIETDDWLWIELTTNGTFSHNTVDFFRREGFIEAYAKSDIVAVLKSPRLRYDRMNGKLFDSDGVQLGDIIVVACLKDFEEGDKELVGLLCEVLSVALQNSELYLGIDRVFEESGINKLIEDGKALPPAAIAGFYEGLRDNLYLAVIEVSKYEDTVSHLAYFRDLFKKLQPEYRYFIHLNNVICLISVEEPYLLLAKDLKKLETFFCEYQIYAGISGRFQDLNELKKRYGEALNALNYGAKSLSKKNIFRFDNYRADHLLNCASEDCRIESHESIVRLLEHDKANGSGLSEALNAYLSFGCSVDSAACALGTNADALALLLNNLSRDFEIDLTDGDTILNLFLTLKHLKIEN